MKDRIAVRPERPGAAMDPLEQAALQGVIGTLPERIIWKWLVESHHDFEPQRDELGGRMLSGGQVIDFVVNDIGIRPVALRVQGDYWHGPAFPGKQAADDLGAVRLQAAGFSVVDLWENDIYEAAIADRVGKYVLGEVGKV